MTRRDRILLMIVGPLGLLLLFYYFIYSPKQTEYQQLRAQLEQQEAVLRRMEETARQITRLREEFARLQAFIAEVETKLPAEKDMPGLLVQLERLARSLFINLESIRPSALEQANPPPGGGAKSQPAAAPSYLRFPIQLTIKGTYEQVIRLATALNDFPRMIAIRDISLSPLKLPELNWNVTVETYVLPGGAR